MAIDDSAALKQRLIEQARELGGRPLSPWMWVKRAADLLLAALGLLLTWPLLLVLCLLIRRGSTGPALFTQPRLGRWGRAFTMYKLRTMVQDAEHKGAGLAIEKNDPRITPIGRLLRATSLDELPQLWNVLRGDMSFVGPRPLPVAYLERWDDRQRLRLAMPQGVTGWSQVTMRNDGPWPERLEADVVYVRDWSLVFDVRIMLLTVGKVLGRRGVATSEGTVEEFKGGRTPDETAEGERP